jgi:hypothetical protein
MDQHLAHNNQHLQCPRMSHHATNVDLYAFTANSPSPKRSLVD